MSRTSAARTVAGVALIGTMLAACATGQGGGDKNAAPAKFDSGATLSGSLKLMGFSGGTDDVGKSRLAAATQAIAPVKLTQTPGAFDVQQFLSAVASGAAPDLIYADRDQLGSFAARGVIMPLDECISGEKIDKAAFRRPALSQVTLAGKVYGIPEFNQVEVVMANSKLLQQAGLTLEDVNGSDWPAVEAAAKSMVRRTGGGKLEVIGYDSKLPEFLPLWAKINGADLLSADGKKAQLDDPKVVEALTFALGIYQEQGGFGRVKAYRDSADFFGKGNQFATSVLGAMPMEQWYINVLNDVSPGVSMSFDSMRGRDGQPISFATGSAWAIPTTAKNPQAACRFARAITATDTWLAAAKVRADARAKDQKPFTGLLTANQKADDAIRQQYVKPSGQKVWDDAIAAMYDANDHTFTLAANPADAEFKAAWQGAVNRALNGQQEPQAALAQGQKEAQAALDKAWGDLGKS
jgi:multiple sugar transport system substrate-binding protein